MSCAHRGSGSRQLRELSGRKTTMPFIHGLSIDRLDLQDARIDWMS